MSISNFVPLFSRAFPEDVRRTGLPSRASMAVGNGLVSDNFLATMNIPLLAGRDFLVSDVQKTAIISESLARLLFANRNAVGQYISLGWDKDTQNLEIIGVAGNARLLGARSRNTWYVYLN